MNNAVFLGCILGFLVLMSHANDNDGHPARWEHYLKYLDPYANPGEPSKQEVTPEMESPEPEQAPSSQVNGSNAKDMTQSVLDHQQSILNQQRHTIDRLLNESRSLPNTAIEAISDQPLNNPPNYSTQPYDGFSAKKTRFNWGGKQEGYQYLDYEFVFDASNTKHIESMSATVSQLTKSGWITDLTRSIPAMEKPGPLTITQMRFRRRR